MTLLDHKFPFKKGTYTDKPITVPHRWVQFERLHDTNPIIVCDMLSDQ